MFVHVYMIGPRSVVFLSLDLVIYIPNTGFEIVTLRARETIMSLDALIDHTNVGGANSSESEKIGVNM